MGLCPGYQIRYFTFIPDYMCWYTEFVLLLKAILVGVTMTTDKQILSFCENGGEKKKTNLENKQTTKETALVSHTFTVQHPHTPPRLIRSETHTYK